MKKSTKTSWRFDWLQVSAVVLVVAMSAFLIGSSDYDASQASEIYDLKTPSSVQVELTESQPTQIVQDSHQWVGRFKITTENSDPVIISSLTFSPQGTLEYQIIRLLTRYPLTLTDNGNVLGVGQTWLYDDRATQTVEFNQPVSIDVSHPLVVDVATDLNNQVEETFGVTLIKVGTTLPINIHGAPIAGKLLEIQERF